MLQRGGGVSSIGGSGKSFYYMVKVLLALFVGLGRRRAVPEPGEPAAGRRRPRDLMDARLQIVAIVGAAGLLLFVLELVRRRRADGALRPAVAVELARDPRAGGLG